MVGANITDLFSGTWKGFSPAQNIDAEQSVNK